YHQRRTPRQPRCLRRICVGIASLWLPFSTHGLSSGPRSSESAIGWRRDPHGPLLLLVSGFVGEAGDDEVSACDAAFTVVVAADDTDHLDDRVGLGHLDDLHPAGHGAVGTVIGEV